MGNQEWVGKHLLPGYVGYCGAVLFERVGSVIVLIDYLRARIFFRDKTRLKGEEQGWYQQNIKQTFFQHDSGIGFYFRYRFAAHLFMQPLECDIQDGYYEDTQDRSDQQSAHSAGADRIISLSPDTSGKDQWKQPDDKRK